IGLGIGRWHIESYLSKKGARVVALCDADPKRLKEVSEKTGIKRCYARAARIIRDPEVDAVSVCVPNALHAPIAVAALKAGKHVLCEKPLAATVRQGEAILRAADASSRIAMVAMKMRYTPEAHYIRGMLDSGGLGEAYYGYSHYLRPVGGIPGWGGWFTTKKISGGGALIDNGVHLLDVNWYLMGCPKPVSVFGKTYAKFGPQAGGKGTFDVEDFGCGLIRFQNGATIYLDNAWTVAAKETIFNLAVFGTKGGATMWPFSVTKVLKGGTKSSVPDLSKKKYFDQFDHFLTCIRTGREPISAVRQGLAMLKMLSANYKADKTGRLVKV
ncbi:MAG: Gfo/Idh/MocA family oxidoreductase, partial [Planctomycetia bacterium]|nr:Gfo/Idh/MocA family oxidoreductase [Planctomycetia bacterium]